MLSFFFKNIWIFQNFKDSSRPVVISIKPLHDSENKLRYLILLDKDNLNYQKLKVLLKENNNGNCEFFFKIIHSGHTIKIKSNDKFKVNMDLLVALKDTEGVISIKEIN